MNQKKSQVVKKPEIVVEPPLKSKKSKRDSYRKMNLNIQIEDSNIEGSNIEGSIENLD